MGVMGVGYAATGGLVGRPEPEAVHLFGPGPRWISNDYEDHGTYEEFTATIQNIREEGNIAVDLYLSDRYIADVNQLSEATLQGNEFEKIATREVYFDAGERRDVGFHERIPEDNDMEHVYCWSKPTTRGAVIRNDGAGGNVRVVLLKGKKDDPERIDEQTAYIGSDEIKRFVFESDSFPSNDWWIEAEPVG
jgi:hypothetical protein